MLSEVNINFNKNLVQKPLFSSLYKYGNFKKNTAKYSFVPLYDF
jgi:hypothetical protein